MDLLEGLLGGGNSATAILALLVGLVFVCVGAAYDGGGHHPYAFWLHVVGGLSVGGGILWFWHEHTWEWLLVLIVSLVYIAVARSLGRSSYAVLGALGLAGTATYFIEKWFSLGSLVPFFPAEPEERGQVGPAARLPGARRRLHPARDPRRARTASRPARRTSPRRPSTSEPSLQWRRDDRRPRPAGKLPRARGDAAPARRGRPSRCGCRSSSTVSTGS